MMDKLKPCPFCGGEAKIKVSASTLSGRVVCDACDVTMKKRFAGNKRIELLIEELICDAWNRRDCNVT